MVLEFASEFFAGDVGIAVGNCRPAGICFLQMRKQRHRVAITFDKVAGRAECSFRDVQHHGEVTDTTLLCQNLSMTGIHMPGGVLSVTLPKVETAKPKQIEIKIS